ncbi:MAG: pentapeptide repeat-containing protein [Myxococcota bacterium]|jgi:uncharacterized protein YjbI with pentapeptide repeats|nr:pentapeptide repeat-containing protein [Myxococcota bacterium]
MSHRKSLLSAIRESDGEALARLRESASEPLSLSGETFKNAHITGLRLEGIDLSNTEWSDCMFDRVRFEGVDLSGSYFVGSTALSTQFEGGTLDNASFEGCVLRRSSFIACSCVGLELADTEFSDCTLAELALDEVDWHGVAFNEGELRQLQGVSGSLNRVTLRGVKVSDFDTEELELEHCSSTVESQGVPAGFVLRQGRRQRL